MEGSDQIKVSIEYKDNMAIGITVDNRFYTPYEMLAIASKASVDDSEFAEELMHILSVTFFAKHSRSFDELFHCVHTTICVNDKRKQYESSYLSYFKKHLDELVCPNAISIKKKNNGKDIPDAWVSIDGKEYPVEIKRWRCGKMALDQIKRYIDAYNAPGGFVIAESLITELPDNVTFISHKGWLK
jgi:hypothetical protein